MAVQILNAMAEVNPTFSDPNSIRQLLAINAFHHVLSSIDFNLPIETQVEQVKNMPDGRLYDVCALESMPEFQAGFLLELYKSAIKGKLFAAFPTFEDKMAHAMSAQAIASIPDTATLDFDKQYNMKSGEYRRKIIEYFFDNNKIDLTITPQDTAIKAILLRNSFKQYCSGFNTPSRTVAIISGAVNKFLPDIIELRKNGLSLLLYHSLLEEFSSMYITYSLNRVMYTQNSAGLSDSASIAKLTDAIEQLKNAPELPDNYISNIHMMMNTSESVSKKNSNPSCLGILVLLLILVPTLTYAASRLIF